MSLGESTTNCVAGASGRPKSRLVTAADLDDLEDFCWILFFGNGT